MTNKQRARKHQTIIQMVERGWSLLGDQVVSLQDTPIWEGTQAALDGLGRQEEDAMLAAFLKNIEKFVEGVCEDLAYPADEFFASLYWQQRASELRPKDT